MNHIDRAFSEFEDPQWWGVLDASRSLPELLSATVDDPRYKAMFTLIQREGSTIYYRSQQRFQFYVCEPFDVTGPNPYDMGIYLHGRLLLHFTATHDKGQWASTLSGVSGGLSRSSNLGWSSIYVQSLQAGQLKYV